MLLHGIERGIMGLVARTLNYYTKDNHGVNIKIHDSNIFLVIHNNVSYMLSISTLGLLRGLLCPKIYAASFSFRIFLTRSVLLF